MTAAAPSESWLALPAVTHPFSRATGFNADKVDGLDGADLRPRFAAVAANGTLGRQRGTTSAGRTAEGTYSVVLDGDVSQCVYTATQSGIDDNNGAVSTELAAGTSNTVRVRTRNGGGADGTGNTAPADKPFQLVVTC